MLQLWQFWILFSQKTNQLTQANFNPNKFSAIPSSQQLLKKYERIRIQNFSLGIVIIISLLLAQEKMNQLQINKLYIRQHIGQAHQTAFYQYFTRLKDFDQFHNWTTERTVQVVKDFQESRAKTSEKVSEDTIKISISPHPSQTLTNNLDPKKFQTYSGSLKTQQKKPTINKNISALHLLEEIEQQMIFTPRKKGLRSTDEKKNKTMLLKHSPASSNLTDPHKLEQVKDNITVRSETKEQPLKQQQPKKHVTQQSKQIIPKLQKVELKRSFELKRQKSELRHQLDLKQKRSSNSDKLFRWKLSQQIPCRKLTVNLGVEKVSITNHEMVHRYFLPDYVIYHISVFPGSLVCKRTYDQFLDFRKNLEKMFPCVKIPYLDSSSWFSQSDITLINKNKVNLELFLNQLICHPTLSKTEIVQDFLTIPDCKAMETALSNYADLPQISKLSELANEQGVIKLTLSQQQNRLIGQLPLWQKHLDNYFEKYIDLVSNLTSQYESIQLIFTQLVSLNYDFRLKMTQLPDIRLTIGNFSQFQSLIQRQQKYFNDRRKLVQRDIDNLKDKYSMTLKYQKFNVNSLQSILQPVQKLTKRYIERLQNQPQSPSSGLQSQNTTIRNQKFTQTIWQESQNINLFKYQVGYLNSRLMQQLHIFNSKLVQDLTDLWEQVFEKVDQASQKLIL